MKQHIYLLVLFLFSFNLNAQHVITTEDGSIIECRIIRLTTDSIYLVRDSLSAPEFVLRKSVVNFNYNDTAVYRTSKNTQDSIELNLTKSKLYVETQPAQFGGSSQHFYTSYCFLTLGITFFAVAPLTIGTKEVEQKIQVSYYDISQMKTVTMDTTVKVLKSDYKYPIILLVCGAVCELISANQFYLGLQDIENKRTQVKLNGNGVGLIRKF